MSINVGMQKAARRMTLAAFCFCKKHLLNLKQSTKISIMHIRKTFIVTVAAVFSVIAAKADEGMWTLFNLPQAVYNQMTAYGFNMPYDDIYNSPQSISKAVVNFSGYCSGVVVSPDGLVLTNHHCGFEAIRSHSTVEHDYMLNGFYAKSHEEELPNKNMFVSFMINQQDITPRLKASGYDTLGMDKQNMLIDSIQKVLSDSVKNIDKTLHVDIDAFYEGNKFYATVYQNFYDLRLVFNVPKSMGKFGGETDNWMWPRQTCDFSVFRIYCDPKTGGPAEYSKDNVPYHPAHWAPVSLQGYKEGDYAMTLGYPGSTSRYMSSWGIYERRNAKNEPRAQVRGVKQTVMTKHMSQSEAVRIKYDSKFAQSANYWKNSIGMNKCIDSIGIIKQKQDYEQRISRWQDSTKYLSDKLDFAKMKSLYGKRFKYVYAGTLFSETFYRSDELSSRAIQLNHKNVESPENSKNKEYFTFKDNSGTWDANLDKDVLAVLLKNYREHADKEFLPKFYNTIDTKYGGDYARFVDDLYSKSMIMSSGKKLYFNRKSYKKDPGVIYGLDLLSVEADIYSNLEETRDSIDEQEKYLCDAKIRMEEDMPHYSDANFTMRLSYGQVGGFNLGGHPSGYYTTAESIVKKMDRNDNNVDYFAEPIMHELLSAKNYGPYQDKTTGKMQLCFLTNNDITGGNSGSPMFDGKGRLIGLAFDGNWDSLSSDINFDRQLARCIGVDIRYVLYMMDRWGHADNLIKEIGAK
jgi:hypothetical protein